MDPRDPAHADHLSGAAYLKSRLGGQIAIGEHIRTVQSVFWAGELPPQDANGVSYLRIPLNAL